MGGIFTGFAVIGAVIAVGYLAERFSIAGKGGQFALTRTAFFITNPALLFTVLAQADLTVVLSVYVPLALLTALATALVYVLISRLFFRRPVSETAIGAMSSSYVNANNMGIPIALYALGTADPVVPVLLVQLLVLAPVYLLILDLASGRKVSVGSILAQPFRNPMIIASFLGVLVAWSGVRLPEPLWAPLDMLGGAAVPLVLLAFGMSLRGSRPLGPGANRPDVVTALALKLLLMPALTYLAAHFLFGLCDDLLLGAVIMASLPSAQNAFLFASRFQRGVPIARDVVLLSTVLSAPILVLAAWLLT